MHALYPCFSSFKSLLSPNSFFPFRFLSSLGFMRVRMAAHILVVVLLAFIGSLTYAYDPDPLQDFCVAILKPPVFVNGFICKDPKMVQAGDFLFKGLDKPGNTNNRLGSIVTFVTVNQLPGLNTLGISMVRIDYAPHGLNPPHSHPRAAEILTVLEGTLYAGFVTSNPDNRLFTKILQKGDVFIFPKGLIHFQLNLGKTHAIAIASLSSQNPGVITIAKDIFGSNPPISDDVLEKAFQVDKKVIDLLRARTVPDNKIITGEFPMYFHGS